ncbi:hypothetical protein FH972_023309 [Carpinus fangiana]|uniref:catechol O-methyltransferase n=1 Tax=Carpinus fangiana TaxID=176857 RepID=A0A5N6KX41_9ROSI|nr:hypothetical protein FH972_023309 [Carpinus fangiana]
MPSASSFEQAKAYAAKGEGTFFDDGREIELLHYIHSRPDVDSTLRNNPAAILSAIDTYARTKKYLMNVGEDKGRIVTDLIAQQTPQTMLELGGYVGYSCILFGAAVKQAARAAGHPTPRYYSLERNPEFAAVIMCLVALAGLDDVVTVVVGSSDASIARLHTEGRLAGGVDMMFLDHYKPAYTTDLKLCEQLGLIVPGRTVLCADNVITPGNPPYLEYVRSTVAEKRATAQKIADGEGNGVDARFADRTAKQYLKREGEAKLDVTRQGKPGLVYESQLVESFEPSGERDGVEVTRCIGEEQI